MKILIILFGLILALSASANTFLLDQDSWVKNSPSGKNLYKLKAGSEVRLLKLDPVKRYLHVTSERGNGWVYQYRGSIQRDFPNIDCGKYTPLGEPIDPDVDLTLCRHGYTLGYDYEAKIPSWVIYPVNQNLSHSANVERSEDFYSDADIPLQYRSHDSDYEGSGYDRGHMAPSASLDASRFINDTTFLMSNMTPQKPGFNRAIFGHSGVWGKLEHVIRGWAFDDDLIVISGSHYSNQSKTIGSGVVVPDAFYKIIRFSDGKLVGFWMNHADGGADSWQDFHVTVDVIETRTGIDFFPRLPDQRMEAITWKL